MSNADPVAMPHRPGPRPSTTPTNPHTQLDQQPDDDEPRQYLIGQLTDLPGVVWASSMISVPGARALTLPRGPAQGPPDSFMIDTEFAHLHPAPDHSLHLVLPPTAAKAAIEAGWAEQHPVARLGIIAPGAVMVYAPRDAHEADIAAGLVRASYAYATGAQSPLRSEPGTTPGTEGTA
ncbi:luciferase domain-containing protein [Georgenia yuyongxinii]